VLAKSAQTRSSNDRARHPLRVFFLWLRDGFAGLTRRYAWPLIALNAVMTLSALAIGAHHLIDVLAGLLLGALAIGAARMLLADGRDRPRTTISKQGA